jgi:hypothetical protein
MSKEYIIKRNNKESGPFTLDELKDKILTKDTLVFTTELGWKPADQITELRDLVRQTEEKKAKPWYLKPATLATAGALVVSGVGFNQYETVTTKQMEKVRTEQRQAEVKDSLEIVTKRETEVRDSTIKAQKKITETIEEGNIAIDKLRSDKSEIETKKIAAESRMNQVNSAISLAYQERSRINEFQVGRSSSTKQKQVSEINSQIMELESAKSNIYAEIGKHSLKSSEITDKISRLEASLQELKHSSH